jgi:hypothetical protein
MPADLEIPAKLPHLTLLKENNSSRSNCSQQIIGDDEAVVQFEFDG